MNLWIISKTEINNYFWNVVQIHEEHLNCKCFSLINLIRLKAKNNNHLHVIPDTSSQLSIRLSTYYHPQQYFSTFFSFMASSGTNYYGITLLTWIKTKSRRASIYGVFSSAFLRTCDELAFFWILSSNIKSSLVCINVYKFNKCMTIFRVPISRI